MKPPPSGSDRWDAVAKLLRSTPGEWRLIAEGERARNEKVREALARRGLNVQVTSRIGNGKDRPWTGWRTWARTI
ncbi:MAG: hypothetical protein KGI98_17645 [Euryarchaeota archaeon]|nr:hypothetical protein [Euryarchaeota archaeon]